MEKQSKDQPKSEAKKMQNDLSVPTTDLSNRLMRKLIQVAKRSEDQPRPEVKENEDYSAVLKMALSLDMIVIRAGW